MTKNFKNNDNIISPNHYASDKGFEVFDVQEAFIHELKGMAAAIGVISLNISCASREKTVWRI